MSGRDVGYSAGDASTLDNSNSSHDTLHKAINSPSLKKRVAHRPT
jgi:hypothetical protein